MAIDDGSNANFQGSGIRKWIPGIPTPQFSGAGSAAPVPYTWSAAPTDYSWQQPPAPAPAPAQTFQTLPNVVSGPVFNGGGSVGGVGGGSFAASPAAAPAPPPPPDYSKMSDGDLQALDSGFMDQKSLLNEALVKYLADYEAQKKGFKSDYETAGAGINRNEIAGRTQIGEDFAARGLGRSGLYDQANMDARAAYGRQRDANDASFADRNRTADFNKGTFERSNTANLAAARKDAIARLTANQSLI